MDFSDIYSEIVDRNNDYLYNTPCAIRLVDGAYSVWDGQTVVYQPLLSGFAAMRACQKWVKDHS